MPQKTIYVSESDVSLFEEAKRIAGKALSSVIATALKEYVSRNTEKVKKMQEISIKVGRRNSERETRFIGMQISKWSGFSTDRVWLMSAAIYKTQKENWAVNLITESKATLLTNKKAWHASGDYLIDVHQSDLIVGKKIEDFKNKLPETLYVMLTELMEKDEKPVEYLDI